MTAPAGSQRLAIVPGTFDPVTNGHLDMIARAAALFDRVVVAVLVNPSKSPCLPLIDRIDHLRASVQSWPTVEVETFEGLLADYVRQRGAVAVVRGVRSATELSDESNMALMNRHLNPACETVFLVSPGSLQHISSRLVREIASHGGSLAGLVPDAVATALAKRRP
jgi:pantetheine-phosphate adenylyltransferase